MSDLQCPARFVLVRAGEAAGAADARLDAGTADPVADLQDLADLHRGETLVVEVPPALLRLLPVLLRPAPGRPARAEVDADGWRPAADGDG